MRCLLLALGLVGSLSARDPLCVVAVERRGLPPFEVADRLYRLGGGQERGLKVGDRLKVRHPGEVEFLGHLWVIEVRADQAVARFEPRAGWFPMKGDQALLEPMVWPPGAGALDPERLPLIPAPRAKTEAPPQEGVLFFLPQHSDLSLAGLKKLETWVEQWGVEGRWAIQVPAAKALKPTLQKQRAETLQAALKALGIGEVQLNSGPRMAEGKFDPTWIQHWDR